MPRGAIASLLSSVLIMFLSAFFNPEWFKESFLANPPAFIVFSAGLLILGWSAGYLMGSSPKQTELALDRSRKKDAEKQRKERKASIRRTVESLEDERMRLLTSIFAYGTAKTDINSREYQLLEGLAYQGLVEGSGRLTITWHLTELCREVMEEVDS